MAGDGVVLHVPDSCTEEIMFLTKLGAGKKRRDVSAWPLIDYDMAVRFIDRLTDLKGCRYIARGIQYDMCDTGQGMAYTEPLTSYKSWASDGDKEIVKKKNGVNVFGNDFLNIFYELGVALDFMHSRKIPHGSLDYGVWFGRDRHIRICNITHNWKTDNAIMKAMKNDVKRFHFLVIELLEQNVKEGEKPTGYTEVFKEICELAESASNLSEMQLFSKWICHCCIVWNIEKRLIFVERVYESCIIYGSTFTSIFSGIMVKLEEEIVSSGTARLKEFVAGRSYGTSVHCFLELTHNFINHYNTSKMDRNLLRMRIEAFSQIERIFPDMLGIIYRLLVENNGRRVCHPYGDHKLVHDIFCEDPSIFELE